MKTRIMSKSVASLLCLSIATLSVLLVVTSVSAEQCQLDVQTNNDVSPAVSPEDESSSVGRSDATAVLPETLDTLGLRRWTVDGGGGVAATGGNLELSGTIGQSDVGVVSGGELTLVGGFWFPLADGDCNIDGGVDLDDFEGFHACFLGPSDGVGYGCGCFDVDQDGDVDLLDAAAFQHAFTGN